MWIVIPPWIAWDAQHCVVIHVFCSHCVVASCWWIISLSPPISSSTRSVWWLRLRLPEPNLGVQLHPRWNEPTPWTASPFPRWHPITMETAAAAPRWCRCRRAAAAMWGKGWWHSLRRSATNKPPPRSDGRRTPLVRLDCDDISVWTGNTWGETHLKSSWIPVSPVAATELNRRNVCRCLTNQSDQFFLRLEQTNL